LDIYKEGIGSGMSLARSSVKQGSKAMDSC